MRFSHWIVLMAMCATALNAAAQPAPKAPTTAPSTQSARTIEQVQQDVQAAAMQMQQAFGALESPDDLNNPAKRDAVAPKALPALKRMVALLDEAMQIKPEMKARLVSMKAQALGMASLLGDADSDAALKTMSQGTDVAEAMIAKAVILQGDWWRAGKDAAKQGLVLDDLQKLIAANPKDNSLAGLTISLQGQNPATPELKARLQKTIAEDLKGELAQQYNAQAKQEAETDAKLKSLENKPLTLKGPALDGKEFSSDQWKGKVILVDFWATWCGPCLGELPRVKKAYKDFHAKGLEVLGVSCDRDAAKLKEFLAKDPEMAWPQLFDAAKPGWHALAKEYGIEGIPTMFLIDKKGVVRTVNARENFEELIPKLLEEKE